MKVASRFDLSIEYAHIYTNAGLGKDQELSIVELDKLVSGMRVRGKTYTLAVMVDDYSFPDSMFDYRGFNSWLAKQNYKPDVLINESQLIPVCDIVLKEIRSKKIGSDLIEYVRTKKYPCSLFIASWYLLRLGFLQHPVFNTNYIANKLHNVLPESFQPFEQKALEIIASTKFVGAERLVNYTFFSGRDLET